MLVLQIITIQDLQIQMMLVLQIITIHDLQLFQITVGLLVILIADHQIRTKADLMLFPITTDLPIIMRQDLQTITILIQDLQTITILIQDLPIHQHHLTTDQVTRASHQTQEQTTTIIKAALIMNQDLWRLQETMVVL
jgi:hypothetical protein